MLGPNRFKMKIINKKNIIILSVYITIGFDSGFLFSRIWIYQMMCATCMAGNFSSKSIFFLSFCVPDTHLYGFFPKTFLFFFQKTFLLQTLVPVQLKWKKIIFDIGWWWFKWWLLFWNIYDDHHLSNKEIKNEMKKASKKYEIIKKSKLWN